MLKYLLSADYANQVAAFVAIEVNGSLATDTSGNRIWPSGTWKCNQSKYVFFFFQIKLWLSDVFFCADRSLQRKSKQHFLKWLMLHDFKSIWCANSAVMLSDEWTETTTARDFLKQPQARSLRSTSCRIWKKEENMTFQESQTSHCL